MSDLAVLRGSLMQLALWFGHFANSQREARGRRRELEPAPARPRWLLTEPGTGYRFQADRRASARPLR